MIGFGFGFGFSPHGALLNQIPAANLATMWLDGTIVDVSGSKYFVNKKGDNVLITGYDFPAGWIKGFPYKSTATIDVFGQTGVPVSSLFQNFDYANKYFCRHIAQVVDGNGVETSEPYVAEIVAYSAALTGDDLTDANTYYGVPEINALAKWVSLTGSDTNDGTKESPYLTIVKAHTSAPTSGYIYVMSGVHDFGGTYINLTKNIIGIGKASFSNLPSGYAFLMSSGSLTGLILNKASGAYPFYVGGANSPVINKCHVSGYYMAVYAAAGATAITCNYCIFDLGNGTDSTFNILKKSIVINTCYIKDSAPASCVKSDYAAGLSEVTVKNCRINSASTNFVYSKYSASLVRINGNTLSCKLIYCEINVDLYEMIGNTGTISYINMQGGTGGQCNIHHNTLSNNNSSALFRITNKPTDIYSNIINISGAGGFGLFLGTMLLRVYNNRIKGNTISVSVGTSPGSITGYFSKNYLENTGSYNVHGVQNYGNNGFEMKYNFVKNAGLINKGDSNDMANSPITDNIIVNGSLVLKGVNNSFLLNNTVINSIDHPSGCVTMLINAVGTTCVDNTIKNNILISKKVVSSPGVIAEETAGLDNIYDNNVCYAASNVFAVISGSNKTFAEWQALGYDAESILLTDEQLTGLFTDLANNDFSLASGSVAIGCGDTLDAAYDDGLDASTDWGSDTELPVIVTKQQGAAWDCGAYVH